METVLDQVCTSCGSTRLPYGRYCLFCGDLLSEPKTKALVSSEAANPLDKAETDSPVASSTAGFWRRVWAGTIDVALEAAGALLLTYRIDFVLAGWRHAWIRPLDFQGRRRNGVHPGTDYRRLVVFRVRGKLSSSRDHREAPYGASSGDRRWWKISFGQATVRHFMKFLSLFSAGVGFMMAVWTKRRQALHDMPSDCIVIRVPREKAFSLLSH